MATLKRGSAGGILPSDPLASCTRVPEPNAE